MNLPEQIAIPEEVVTIIRTLERGGHEAWCVGGAIRDTLLEAGGGGDYDVATSATPEQVQRLFPHTVAVGLRFGTVGVLDRNRDLHEVTTFRQDVETDGRHAVVAFGASLEEDLARRDFTVNAIAYHPLRHEWRDPFDGTTDLERRTLRAVGDPATRFREDYLRILRLLRFTARLEFSVQTATWDAAVAEAEGLRGLSAERVRDEWFKGLRSAASVERLVKLWHRVGAAAIWLPELVGGEALERLPPSPVAPEARDPVVLTALLCLDPVAVMRRLKASNQDTARAAALVVGPAEPAGGAVDALSVRRWLAAVGDAADDLRALWEARHGAAWPWERQVADIRRRGDPLTRGDLAIGGGDLIELGMPPGPAIGEALERLLALVIDDPGKNTRKRLLHEVKAAGTSGGGTDRGTA